MKHKPFNDMPDTEKIKAKKNIDEIFILFFFWSGSSDYQNYFQNHQIINFK
jgi:hypothetical protein